MDSDTHTTGKGPAANLTARRVAGQVQADPVQEKIVVAADDHGLWGVVLPLVELMYAATRSTLAQIMTAKGHATLQGAADAALMAEQWETLLDLARLMPPANQDELAAIVRSLGAVDPDLLRRVAQGAGRRGFGSRFEASDPVGPL